MTTITSSGQAAGTDSKQATGEAVRSALAPLGGTPVRLGFLFASPKLDLAACLETARRLCGPADWIACTTAGELTEKGLIPMPDDERDNWRQKARGLAPLTM